MSGELSGMEPLPCQIIKISPTEIVLESPTPEYRVCLWPLLIINAVTMREFRNVEAILVKILCPDINRILKKDAFMYIPPLHRDDIQKYLDNLLTENVLDVCYHELRNNEELCYNIIDGVISSPKAKEIYDKVSDAVTNAFMFATTRELK